MEKRELVTQKLIERFERVRAYLVARPALFAAQGSVVATSRTYRGRRLGPYFQLAWREAGRQRRLYPGRSLELVDRVRKLLHQLQHPLRQRRLFTRLKRQTRSALRRWMADLRPLLARWGVELKGFEFRGARQALRRYAQTLPLHELALAFTNDYNQEGEDRSLMLDKVVFCGDERESRRAGEQESRRAGEQERGTKSWQPHRR